MSSQWDDFWRLRTKLIQDRLNEPHLGTIPLAPKEGAETPIKLAPEEPIRAVEGLSTSNYRQITTTQEGPIGPLSSEVAATIERRLRNEFQKSLDQLMSNNLPPAQETSLNESALDSIERWINEERRKRLIIHVDLNHSEPTIWQCVDPHDGTTLIMSVEQLKKLHKLRPVIFVRALNRDIGVFRFATPFDRFVPAEVAEPPYSILDY